MEHSTGYSHVMSLLDSVILGRVATALYRELFDESASKDVRSVRKHLTYRLPDGRFGPTKYNNIGTFEQKRQTGNC